MAYWDMHANNIRSLTNKEEEAFFKETCPVSEKECHRAFYHGVAGIYSAVNEQDQAAFQSSIREIQECKWKKAERALHGNRLLDLENRLYDCGATAVGMSSLGPGLFFLAHQIEEKIEKMKKEIPDCTFVSCLPSNVGREVKWLN